MIKIKLHIATVLCLMFYSCNQKDSHYSTDYKIIEKSNVYADSIVLQDLEHVSSVVEELCCIDNFLILIQHNRDSIFQIIDSKNDSIIVSFGKIGHARNEFLNIPQKVYCIRNKDGQPLLCIQEEKCTKIVDIKKSIDTNVCTIADIIKEQKEYFFYSTYHFNKNKHFNYKTVSYEDARDGIYIKPTFCLNDDFEKKWDVFPNIITPSFSNIIDCAYAMKMLVSPNGEYAVGIQHFVDNVTIFDFHRNKTTGIINPNSYTLQNMELDFSENNMPDKLIWYNTSGCASDNCFMVIKDGRLYKNVAYDDNEDGSSIINKYGWDGQQQSSIVLNKKARHIAYCEMTDKLYVIGNTNILYFCKL